MRIITLSVDGIFQAAQRGLYDWLKDQDADVVCLQDLRALEPELDADVFHPEGYYSYFFDSGEPHTNGVAIYTRVLPKAMIYGLGFSSGVDMQGRYLQIDFGNVSIGSLLAPASKPGESQEEKMQFFDDLQALLYKVTRKRRQFIICGNWQMAHTEKDVRFPDQAWDKPIFMDWEQQWLDQLYFQIGYVDSFRVAQSDDKQFSYWPDGVGADAQAYRSDFQIASYDLGRTVKSAGLYRGGYQRNEQRNEQSNAAAGKAKTEHPSELGFSSHLPVMVEYDLTLEG